MGKHSMHCDPQDFPPHVDAALKQTYETGKNASQLAPKQPADKTGLKGAGSMAAKAAGGNVGQTKPSPQGNSLSKKSPDNFAGGK